MILHLLILVIASDEDLSTEITARQSLLVCEPDLEWPRKLSVRCSILGGPPQKHCRTGFKAWASQVQIRCDGHFVCIGPECKLQCFEASWEALVDHHNDNHAAHESDQLDYYKIKLCLPRQYEATNHRLQQAAMSQKTWDSWTIKEQHTQLALDMQRFKLKASGCDKVISQTRQFQDLRMLKKAFRIRYADFLRISDSSPELFGFAAMLRSAYRSSRGLHRLGFGVFRKVLAGTAPTTVLEVFAFELLSGAMTNVMRNVWKKDIPNQPRDIDYLIWRSAIEDDGGKALFDDLMNKWFPNFQVPPNATSTLGHLPHEAMRDYILNIVLSSKSTDLPNFSAFSSFEITTQIYGTRAGACRMDRGSFDSLWGIESSPWQEGILQVSSKPMTVRDSIVFTGFYLFMICESQVFYFNASSPLSSMLASDYR